MRPTPWTGGVAAVAAVLGASGLFLNAPAAAAGGAGLAVLLAVRGALFLYRTGAVADGIGIERELERELVRQGAPVGVATRVTVPAPPGLEATVTDLPPASAEHDPREARVVGGWARYRVRLTVPGEVAFRGLRLETADRFFSTTLLLTAPPYAGTVATVFAPGTGRTTVGDGTAPGERERERQSVLRGQGTRSYRPFRSGDDPALVDWKLSAKFGRFFVREPTGRASGAPFVVVDLPPADAPGAAAVLSGAGDAVEAAVREFGACSLLVVAGGEVVLFCEREPDLAALVRPLAYRTGEPADPLYRVRDPFALRQRQRSAEGSASAPARRLGAALRANLASAARTPFEREVDRALGSSEERDVVVYSAGTGDASHLALIGAAVRRRGRHLRVLLPRPDPAAVERLTPYGVVEAL